MRKEEIIDCLKLSFISVAKSNLPIFGVTAKTLHKFTTTDTDVGKGKNRIPSAKYLLDSEKVIPDSQEDDDEEL